MAEDKRKTDEMSTEEKRDRVIQLAFGGDSHRFEKFYDVLRTSLPKNERLNALRGASST